MTWYEKIIAAHTAVTDSVSYNERMKSDRYFVWGELGTNDLSAGNGHAERAVQGYTDLYTKQEFDAWKGQLEDTLTEAGIPWSLNSVQYESETGFTHYEWYWEVCSDGSD